MLKFLATIGAILWIVVGMAELVSLAPPIAPTAPKPSENTGSNPNSSQNPHSGPIVSILRIVRQYRDEITAISTAFLSVITAGLVYIARQQYKTTQAQLRAYVWIRATALNDWEIGKLPYGLLEIGNSGVTPAYEVTTLAACLVYPFPLPDNTRFPPMNKIDGTMTKTKTVIYPSIGPINTTATCDMDWPNGVTKQIYPLLLSGPPSLCTYLVLRLTKTLSVGREKLASALPSISRLTALGE
jgi:hypothetical protein